jgi:hypothetical protein
MAPTGFDDVCAFEGGECTLHARIDVIEICAYVALQHVHNNMFAINLWKVTDAEMDMFIYAKLHFTTPLA